MTNIEWNEFQACELEEIGAEALRQGDTANAWRMLGYARRRRDVVDALVAG